MGFQDIEQRDSDNAREKDGHVAGFSAFFAAQHLWMRERERKTNTGRLKTLLRLLLELIIIWCFVIFWCFTVTERFTPSRLESYARLGWPEATRTLARFANPWRHEPEFWVGIRVWRLSTGFSLFPFAPGVVGAC